MATGTNKRLSGDEVHAIFQSLRNSHLSCALDYKVIPSGKSSGGRSFKPPAWKFEDGIYILCDTWRAGFPPHLLERAVKEPPSESCEWKHAKLETPSKDFRLRQYAPKSGEQRGEIWTMVVNDEDDLEYRIFHVFRYIKPKKESRKKAIKSESRKKPRVSRQEASAWGHDTRCKTCGRDDDEAVLMQCSFCEQGYRHTYCVGLVEVPEGHWFCSGACWAGAANAAMSHVNVTSLAETATPSKLKTFPVSNPESAKVSPHANRAEIQQAETGGDDKKLPAQVTPTCSSRPKQTRSSQVETLKPGHILLDKRSEQTQEQDVARAQSRASASTPIFFQLTRGDIAEASPSRFVTADSRNATFSDLRNIIQNANLLAADWEFYFPTLGSLVLSQESSLGPVADFLGMVAPGGEFGDGTSRNPFLLSLWILEPADVPAAASANKSSDE